jgi:hypothetical protein
MVCGRAVPEPGWLAGWLAGWQVVQRVYTLLCYCYNALTRYLCGQVLSGTQPCFSGWLLQAAWLAVSFNMPGITGHEPDHG